MRYLDPDYNPLLDPVETGYRKRVDQFVRDLAWGVLAGYWSPYLKSGEQRKFVVFTSDDFPIPEFDKRTVEYYKPRFGYGVSENLNKQFEAKWDLAIIPSKEDLWLWGFVEKGENMLMTKAFDLLYLPSTAPKVFISYRHVASSTLALAIEARLKYLGNNNIFIDKELSPGKRFDTQITDAIKNCSDFVLLVDKDLFALGSGGVSWVKKEYLLAIEEKKDIIPILHPNVEENDLKALASEGYDRGIQHIDCQGISAFDYEFAINRLLNTLGYATY